MYVKREGQGVVSRWEGSRLGIVPMWSVCGSEQSGLSEGRLLGGYVGNVQLLQDKPQLPKGEP